MAEIRRFARDFGTRLRRCVITSRFHSDVADATDEVISDRLSLACRKDFHCIVLVVRTQHDVIARHFDIYDDAIFSTQVTRLAWNSDNARWRVETDRRDNVEAQFVVLTTGPLNRPKLPDIPGIESFKGYSFHTDRAF